MILKRIELKTEEFKSLLLIIKINNMSSIIFSLLEFIYAIVLIALVINLYSNYQDDKKRQIFAIVVGVISFYYFIFASMQLIKEENLAQILSNISLISLLITSSLSLFYLSDFISVKYNKYFNKFCIFTFIFSIFVSLALLITPEIPIFIKNNGFYWAYALNFSESSILLLLFFLILFIGILLSFIILLIDKNYKELGFCISYAFIFILPFFYFANFKNPIFLVLIQNLLILIWVLINFFLLKNYQKEIVNFYQFQINIVEELISFQFLLNKRFYIVDASEKTRTNLGYYKEEIIGKRIDKIVLNFFDEKNFKNILKNDDFVSIFKLRTSENKELNVEINIKKIKDKKNNTIGYILLCNDIEEKQKFEIQSERENLAKERFNNFFKDIINFIEKFDYGIAFLDLKGRLITANKSFIFYYKKINNKVLIIDDFINSKQKSIEKIIEFNYDNKTLYYKYSLIYIYFQQDLPVGYICLIEDYTEKLNIQKNLEKTHYLFKSTILNFPFPLIIFNNKGKVILYSKRILNYFYKMENLENIDLNALNKDFKFNSLFNKLKTENFAILNNYLLDISKIINKEKVNNKIYNIEDLQKIYCNLILMKLDDEGNLYSLIIEDIDENFKNEAKILRIKNEIDNQIDEKTKFLYSMTLEFRKYLIDLIENVNLLLRYKIDNFKEFIDKIKENANTLLSQIDSIILHEILESNKVEINYQNVEINSFFKEILTKYIDKIKSKNLLFNSFITFQVDGFNDNITDQKLKNNRKLYLYIDPMLIEIIIYNLMSNAIKFTEKGSIDFIANVKKLGLENYELIIKIKDTGIGIKKEKLDTIFSKYYQIDDVLIKRFSGLGLGLYNTKKICEHLGAELEIESEENKGTLATLILPVMKSDNQIENNFKNEIKSMKLKIRFILTFNNSNIFEMIKFEFEKDNYSVLNLEDLNKLENNIEKSSYSIVLFDLDLLDKLQIKQIEKIKNNLIIKSKISFIFLYSFPYSDAKLRELIGIADLVITKPFDIEFFKNRLEKYFI